MSPSTFLEPLLDGSDARWGLRNSRSGRLLAQTLESAFDSKNRRRGLLGRRALDAGAALIIAPCNGIHTFFMKFAIDAIFVGREGRVVRIYHSLRAWRIGFSWTAFAVVELPAATAEQTDTHVGDFLEIVRQRER